MPNNLVPLHVILQNFHYFCAMEQNEEIYTFKPDFTKAEVQELIAWFEERMDQLPDEMEINKSSSTKNLRFTVTKLISMLKHREVNVTICGYIAHLALIRKRLELAGMK